MGEFRVESRQDKDGVTVIGLAGEMDRDSYDLLEHRFNGILEAEDVRGVVVDLGGLEAVTSAGLGAILNLRHILAGRKGRLATVSGIGTVGEIVAMLGLGEALGQLESVEEAIRVVSAATAAEELNA